MHRYRSLVTATLVVTLTSAAAAQNAAPAKAPARVQPTPAATPAPARSNRPIILPGTPQSAFATVSCQALTASDRPLPNVVLRIRDARLGRIVALKRTDAEGRVGFDPIDPGSYIIELIADDQSLRAASELFSVNAGDSIATIVRLPSPLEAFAALLGHSAPQAAAIAAAAAAAGVLAVQSTNDVSPR